MGKKKRETNIPRVDRGGFTVKEGVCLSSSTYGVDQKEHYVFGNRHLLNSVILNPHSLEDRMVIT